MLIRHSYQYPVPCCLRRKLSGEAAIVTSGVFFPLVTIAASPLNFRRKQQEKKPSGTQGIVPASFAVQCVESNCHFRKKFTCSTGFKSYTVKVFTSEILFIVGEINLETSGWGKIRLAGLLHEVLVVFIEKTENEIGIKRAVNRFLWDCCDRGKEIKAFMT